MNIKNARWDSQDKTQILCDVYFDDGPLAGQWAPYRAMQTDPVEYGRLLFADLAEGKYGPIAEQGASA